MAKDAKGHGSDPKGGGGFDPAAHKRMVGKVLASGDVRGAMAHTVTGYDRQQQARSEAKGTYYNQYALPQYLGAVDRAHTDILRGVSHADAINNHFNGSLARTLHKNLGTGGTDVDTMRRERLK